MIIIGLCGQSGSGKSTVADFFRQNGYFILDADKIYHELISERTECLSEIEKVFGKSVINNDSLDRKKLGEIVFNDETKRTLLNKTVHPFVCKKIFEDIEKNSQFDLFLIDAPLLFEAELDKKCDLVIGVVSDIDMRIFRISKRDGITSIQAKNRIKNQLSDDYIFSHCDYVIENNSTMDDLKIKSKNAFEFAERKLYEIRKRN